MKKGQSVLAGLLSLVGALLVLNLIVTAAPPARGGASTDDGLYAAVAVAPLDGLFGDRVFVRMTIFGRVEQNIYTPGSGYTGWIEVPD